MRVDLHCHTEASDDCQTRLTDMPDRCRSQNVRVQAITDHNVIWGAQQLRASVRDQGLEATLSIIVGEEISTRQGEIIGLFLQEVVPAGLSAEETAEIIHAQGGLVLLPHGFDPLKRHRLRSEARERLADHIDIVESFNARISAPHWNRVAAVWATQHRLPVSGGSDAHTLTQIGDGWIETVDRLIQRPDDLMEALWSGEVAGRWVHPVPSFLNKVWAERFMVASRE
ncbi:PHP domain-containing protein [Deinococcus detaillensis]|uniref:PHP domain-containing protein n=1 Tax=Deinococcus detaillensis TaxID=2592048 RepID=A0A553UZ30_9DEIO|nr:PHP domain-containing protein [Deinococcus detaillensis]TSA85458.1 PHP domain-containing protein [Deinococcus detaillensis]